MDSSVEFLDMPLNPYALGMVAEFISHFPPFSDFGFRTTLASLTYQLGTKNNLVASRNDSVIGYLGWVQTSVEIAERWVKEDASLTPVDNGPVVAITILATTEPSIMLSMIRHAKHRHPTKKVYWRRYFTDGRQSQIRTVGRV